ncbi:class III extradiol dioxygenase subunit B-like domain-containing protein [Tenggerimyces flavus]|uniref:Class III extradiol dioxygenase subunit B-like domain-containing protein n=1 Tax=Tenggerimyces flavus TaxID=1708749 RepID=A0ABV7YB36_9ACTN|nr:class III extradiol dioxygenase subunit B-like domain-containing protein [Tenggerimyces flavus]MBM7787020.1 hypothetical protein [Tenggerimyces flavus]
MSLAAAVCPHPPALVPEVAPGAVETLEPLRAACDAAVRELVEVSRGIVCVGTAPEHRWWGSDASGTLRPYGVDVHAGGTAEENLPLSLTIGAWLLDRAGYKGPRRYVGVPDDWSSALCAELGRELNGVGLLVMGDGSARRGEKAPGYLDERAEPFDDGVADLFANGDVEGLLRLDPATARELLIAGRAPWQVLAGAAEGGTVKSELRSYVAPYGVAYYVASWGGP